MTDTLPTKVESKAAAKDEAKVEAKPVEAPRVLPVQLLKRTGEFIADTTIPYSDTWPEMLMSPGRFFRLHTTTGPTSMLDARGFYFEVYEGPTVAVQLKEK
jgi:hypothetical protein